MGHRHEETGEPGPGSLHSSHAQTVRFDGAAVCAVHTAPFLGTMFCGQVFGLEQKQKWGCLLWLGMLTGNGI